VCGIAGFELAGAPAPPGTALSLLTSLRSRGPDGAWVLHRPTHCLVQTRLAIIDLSERVVYPMPNEDRSVWLLFNGEIYNHGTLRRELEGHGHVFATDCDAEVVVHGYEEWSLGVLPRLNGMFAVALLDERRRELVLARDELGIKPLVHTTGPQFAFASDAMSLVSAGLSSGEVDEAAAREFATFHYVPPPRTGVRDVRQVDPGTAVIRNSVETRIVRWSSPPFDDSAPQEPVQVEDAERIVRSAVARQLEADVDVGVFLSGGVDSSLVLAYAVDGGARPECFTVAFTGHGDYDESERASEVALALGVSHHREVFAPSFTEAVEAVVGAFDQPFADSSAIATIAVSRLARSRVKVVLSGTGGDDLFGGYYRHRAHRLRPLLRSVPAWLTSPARGVASKRGGERRSRWALSCSYAARLLAADTRSDIDLYLSLIGAATSPVSMEAFRFDFDPRVVRTGVALRLGLDDGSPVGRLRQLQRFELATYLPGDLLTKEDRAGMAVGLESRVPLLDGDVLRLAASVPDTQKTSLKQGKLLLRALAHRRLGAAHVRARKRGFAVPLQVLMNNQWREEVRAWFAALDSELVDGKVVRALLDDQETSAASIWALGVLAGWEYRVGRARISAQTLAA
jgi:asparagine synthase (glutamine-hydrolysing)